MCAILMSLYADGRMGKIAGAQLSERKWIKYCATISHPNPHTSQPNVNGMIVVYLYSSASFNSFQLDIQETVRMILLIHTFNYMYFYF